uniref:Uncharacterized protein n=1 Tax=Panagrolaimus sp. ES5 TaxID=591445 RepID=A0AC34G5H4_9BILA
MLSSFADLRLQPGLKFLNYDEFRASAYSQIFSFPESIIFYMAKNPPYAENPILVFHCLLFDDTNGWKTCIRIDGSCPLFVKDRKYRKIDLDMDKIQSKIWILFKLQIFSTPTLATSLIPKFYNGDIRDLELVGQNISFHDFLFFSKELQRFNLRKSTVVYENGTVVPCEIILAELPKLQIFLFDCTLLSCDFSKTAAEFVKISHFKNLLAFFIIGVSESFDIDTFFNYLKQNNKTKVALGFPAPLSVEYKEKLQAIIDEVLDAESPRTYLPPFINFDGQLREMALFQLYKKHNNI